MGRKRHLETVAWAAGLYEGEGSCSLNKANGYPQVQLGMTDRETVERFMVIVGFGSIWTQVRHSPNAGAPRKPMHRWQTGGWNHVAHVRELFAEWLSERRLDQFDRALATRPQERPASAACKSPSEAGYRRHLRAKEPPCAECRYAHRVYERKRTGAKARFPDDAGYRTKPRT